MFGFGKKAVPVGEVVAGFIQASAKAADDSYKLWISELLQAMADEGVETDTTAKLLNEIHFKYAYFAALCALGALAIRNIIESEHQPKIYNALFLHLQSEFNSQDRKIAEMVFNMMKRIDEDTKSKGEMPNFVCVSILVQLLGIDKLNGAQRLFKSPAFALRLGAALLNFLPNFWKPFSAEFKVG